MWAASNEEQFLQDVYSIALGRYQRNCRVNRHRTPPSLLLAPALAILASKDLKSTDVSAFYA